MPKSAFQGDHQPGEVRQVWAEIFDSEVGRYLLMPIKLNCYACPGNRMARKGRFFSRLSKFRREIRRRLWVTVVGWIETAHTGTNDRNASQIVDGCLAIWEGLGDGKTDKTRH